MTFTVKPATLEDKSIIAALLHPYLEELSRFPDEHPHAKDSNGVYLYRYLDAFWQEPGVRFPYLLYDGDEITGFALVRKNGDHWEMSEFYVKPLFRHRGLGERYALNVISRHQGQWRIEFNRNNIAGESLWQKIATKYSGGDFTRGQAEGGHDFVLFSVSDNQELFTYYNERAPEYEAFYEGQFPTGARTPELYQADTKAIQQLLPHYVKGNCIDIACGTGFWLICYHQKCSTITLIDQAEGVLAETQKKILQLGIQDKTRTIRGDVFKDLPLNHEYNTAVSGFLISHFNDAEIKRFLSVVKEVLKPGGTFVIIDSIWGDEVKTFHKTQSGAVTRRLYDGREFRIFKRFFTQEELRHITAQNAVMLEIVYWGKVFFCALAHFKHLQA